MCMASAKTLYVSDMDGTLLLPNKTIGAYTRQTLNALSASDGLCFSVATARSIATVYDMLAGADISAPVITLNGTCLFDLHTRRYLDACYLPAGTARRLLLLMDELDAEMFVMTLPRLAPDGRGDNAIVCYYREIRSRSTRHFYEERLPKAAFKRFVRVDRFADIADDRVIYFTTSGPIGRMQALAARVGEIEGVYTALYLDRYDETVYYLEFCSDQSSKPNAVRKLKEMVGAGRVVAFGDNTNDLGMFAQADECYAVANAIPEARAAATAVIGSNAEEGVAHFLADRKAAGLL